MSASESDQKALFQIVKNLLHSNQGHDLPKHDSLKDLCDSFGTFFENKITKIRFELDQCAELVTPNDTLPAQASVPPVPNGASLRPVEHGDVVKIINKSPNKSCDLDPVPTWMMKQLVDTTAPVITDIVNKSITSSTVPSALKHAHVTPILKKPSLDPDCLKNHRPISNLPLLAKILEKVASAQPQEHVVVHNLQDKYQSAYIPAHSTETAMLRITNDLLRAADDGKAGCLVLLDLSAAFDTIDHKILLRRLSSRIDCQSRPSTGSHPI